MRSKTSQPGPRRAVARKAALPAAFAAFALTGCASLSPDGGSARVQQLVAPHLPQQELAVARSEADRERAAQQVLRLLAEPLSADAAVQIALLNNRGLQARFAQLGLTEAETVMASRLPNPGFSFGRSRRGDEREIERGLHFNLAQVLALPWTAPLEARRFEQAQSATALAVLMLAADTRKAWIHAVAAEESVRYAAQVMQAAQASAELARRMAAVGNFNKLQQAREQGFLADAALGAAMAERQALAAREKLIRLLGLWGEPAANLKLPERLPELPTEPADQPDIESRAMAQRLDLQGARQAMAQLAANLQLTKSTRFVNVLELGLMHNSSNEEPRQRGWEISFELPLFDGGGARVAQAEAAYRKALHEAAELAVNARSEVREAYGQYRAAWDIAHHHTSEIVPLRQRIAEENLLRYNGMLIGVFELLADARVQIASVNAAIQAQRDFWLAQADLEMALIGKPNLGAMPSAAATPAAAEPAGH
jgi:outer membrane protein TolC